MNTALARAALRANALYLPLPPARGALQPHTAATAGQLATLGFTLTEDALRRLDALSPENQDQTLRAVAQTLRADANWTPLVRDWKRPTGQTQADMLYATLCNIIDASAPGAVPGVRMPCGCLVPDGLFDLPRYTGCPLCGRPFEVHTGALTGAKAELRVLGAFTDADAERLARQLLESRAPLDATQADTLRLLLSAVQVPQDVEVPIRETMVLAVDALLADDRADQAARLLRSPSDVLRFLWAEKTGVPRILRPRTLVGLAGTAWTHLCPLLDLSGFATQDRVRSLRLHYPRSRGRMMARVLAAMPMPVETMCVNMHPHRQMWVHMIRALRLSEHARRPGMERLAQLLDRFYRGDYTVPQGAVDTAMRRGDAPKAARLLEPRPGAFARQLFNIMLTSRARMGTAADVMLSFRRASAALPARLMLSLANSAELYFQPADMTRRVVVATGIPKYVPINPKLAELTDQEQYEMAAQVRDAALDSLRAAYARLPRPEAAKIHIAPELDAIPLPVGDRSAMVTQMGAVIPGMRIPVAGDQVRVFLHWGLGMPAQPLDLDLTALIAYPDGHATCAFHSLTVTGAQHSGDMRQIPDQVGTAEYIELDLPALHQAGASYVAFTAQCYSGGQMPPGTMFGWMSAAQPMTVDDRTGVSYDPATVQQLITLPATAGWRSVCFGMLDVAAREVIVLDFPGMEQVGSELTTAFAIELLKKLEAKLTLGAALRLYADAQGLEVTSEPDGEDTIAYASPTLTTLPALLDLLLPS